ncbi:MAG TPA: prephenate dehydratase [Dehalococcoidia bacterium]|nr:prephenate dehydratase [Dehalococcoidia bacterium]
MPRVGYLGPAGTNSEVAALRAFPGAEHVPYPTITAVARAIEAGELDAGVAPIENSLQGSVTETVDLLIRDDALAIAGELVLPIEHCLMAKPGTARASITVIYSHPQSLGQCRRYLEAHFPDARTEASLSNAEAVATAMRLEGAAAIGPARAAEIYGAEILERAIEDSRVNKTRFVVLAREGAPPTGRDKTSIAFAVAHDRPGTLVSVLHEFADRQINLTKIESRPSGEELGVYIFLIDLEGHREDPLVAQALAAVREQAQFFRIFGSYPAEA